MENWEIDRYTELKEHTLINQWEKGEISSKTRKLFEMNENKYATYQTILDAVKAELRGKFIAVYVYINKNKKVYQQAKLPT